MTAFEPVKVADQWGDNGTVAIGTAAPAGQPSADVVQVLATDSPYEGGPLDFTPSRAREFAAAIVAAANHIDPEGGERPFVVDSDGDVWTRQPDGTYSCPSYGFVGYTLAEIADEYGVRS